MAGRQDVFQKAMNDGHSAAWDQMWDQAAEAYKMALAEFPDNAKALNSLALALYQLQKYEESLKLYLRATRITPDDPMPMEKAAHLYERIGSIREAVAAAMQAAELYLKMRDADKAIENWLHVTSLNPENVNAYTRLAMVHEKMGQPKQAVTEYIAIAALLQRAGNPQKAVELVQHSLQLDPSSTEARQAQSMLKSGQLLPKPLRPKGGTGPLRMAQVKQMDAASGKQTTPDNSLDPVAEARKVALQMLADMLFELTDESPEAQQRRGLQAMIKGTGQLGGQQSEQTRILLHLSTAIDSQTKNNEAQAAEELEHALEVGFEHPALYFDLGYLRTKGERYESALRNLQHCVKHNDFGLGARLLSGQILRKIGRMKESAMEFLEALKIADSAVVPAEQAVAIRQLYEPLVEAQSTESDGDKLTRLCDNINEMLMKPNWRGNLIKARQQLPKTPDGGALPLAEILIQAQSSQVLEAMNNVNQLARTGYLRSAMDEAFEAIRHAPTYLPLHTLIGDLLIRDDRPQDAIAKFMVVAQAYSVRGEAAQAVNIFRRILQLAPMDMGVRTRLIEQLSARGQLDEAISEYIELADIYYRLAELDMARKTYATALRFAQQPSANRQWGVKILNRMADIDMQRLDWKQAMRVFEQIRTIKPDDANVRKNLIELNLRMAQQQQAQTELDNFLAYLDTSSRGQDAIAFLKELIEEHGEQASFHRALAEQYRKAGRMTEAIQELDIVGNILIEKGDKPAVIEIVSQILTMNPPNAAEYRQLLQQLQSG
jgi:tetratricopeptide (TPR) repeat protein